MAPNLFSERVPPQNLEAEQSVLGACLIDREALVKVRTHIRHSDDFYSTQHGIIWSAIQEADKKFGRVDLITMQEQLNRPSPGDPNRTLLEQIGGVATLTNLIHLMPTTANAEQYAQIVAQKAALRRFQMAAMRVAEECYSADDPQQVAGDLQKVIDDQVKSAGRVGLRSVAGRIGSYAEERYAMRGLPNADWIPSRFPELRQKCPYLRREFTLFAAPPNNGKTTWMLSEAYFQAELGYEVAAFELEMSETALYDKLIAQAARLDSRAIRMGALTEEQWFLYRAFGRQIDQLENLSLNTETTETMTNIRWQCLRRKAERGLDVVYIDFIDRVAENREQGERYDQLLAKIAGIGQAIARECNCHVIILAQIDVRVLQRANPIPMLADLSNAKTNLAAWPDNVITAVQPGKAVGDGRVKPAIHGMECSSAAWKKTLVLSVAKGRFSEGGALLPIYAELNTGFLGSLRRPWPWQKEVKEDPNPKPGQWDQKADEAHKEAMRKFREDAQAATIEPPEDDDF